MPTLTTVIEIAGLQFHLGLVALVVGAALIPLFLGSTWAGSRYFATGGQRHFRAAAFGILLVIGPATVAAALR